MDGSLIFQLLVAAASWMLPEQSEQTGETLEAEPRIFTVPPGAPVTIGLIFGVPISILVPRLRKRLNDYGLIPANEREQFIGGVEAQGRSFQQEIPSYAPEDPMTALQLERIDSYFAFLGLDREYESCRKKFLCELAADPDKYYPVSDIYLRKIKSMTAAKEGTRGFHYLKAAKDGFNGDKSRCEKQFKTCSITVPDLVHMRALRVIQLLAKYLKINFTD